MSNIGRFVRRLRLPADESAQPVIETKWHLVDSEVADRLVLRCGRSLRAPSGTVFEFAAPIVSRTGMTVEPDGTCAYCKEKP